MKPERSVVRGAFIIAGYTLVLALHFGASLLGQSTLQTWLIPLGLPLALMATHVADGRRN